MSDDLTLFEQLETAENGTGNADNADSLATPDKRTRTSWTGTRLVALIAGVAVVSLLIGIGIMQFIVSPAEIAARTAAPKAGPITAPVEKRSIENTVVMRGEVTYANAVSVTIDAGSGEDRPVVTGHVPKVGDLFKAGDLALEVSGRPVVVLPGELPAYRDLSFGMRGPDVVQLKAALIGLGFAAGDPANDTFDWDTATALGALYEQIGYPAATGGDETETALKMAERALRDANVALTQAQVTLTESQKGSNSPGGEGGGPSSLLADQAAVAAATDAVSDAQEELTKAQEDVLPTLPSSEVLFLSDLPRRVDEVTASRGEVLEGSPMSVSGAALTIVGSISAADAKLIAKDTPATFPGPDGEELEATVAGIDEPKKSGESGSDSATDDAGGDSSDGSGSSGGSGESGGAGGSGGASQGNSSRYTVNFTPGKLTSEQIEALRGTNVRVRVPVASTDGEVLAVPIAAISSGSGGHDRVELIIEGENGADDETELVDVTVGLAADGFVEISGDDKRLQPGAKVVVGR